MTLLNLFHGFPVLPQIQQVKKIGQVIATRPGWVEVAVAKESGCKACHSQSDCSVAPVADALSPAQHRVWCASAKPLVVGSQVEVLLPQAALREAAILGYLYPLSGFMLGMFSGPGLFSGFAFSEDFAAGLGAVMGCGLAWILARQKAHKQTQRWRPEVVADFGVPMPTKCQSNETEKPPQSL